MLRRHDRLAEFSFQLRRGELAGWSYYDLEAAGRLAEPMSYNPATGKYVPISWEDAFAMVGGTMRRLDSPRQASFYTSGRLTNEATYRAVPRAKESVLGA
jgi:anaerobic selenocysteine-containing dehydrogenase